MAKTHHRRLKKQKHNMTNKQLSEYTICGLHQWYESVFEKLGWMLLAKRNGWMDQVMTYKNCIDRLEHGIEHRWKQVKDTDTKKDLYIMLDNVKCLKIHVAKDFV